MMEVLVTNQILVAGLLAIIVLFLIGGAVLYILWRDRKSLL